MMGEWLIVLAVEAEEGEGHPARWDWAALLDTPSPVGIAAAQDVTGEHAGLSLFRLGMDLIRGADLAGVPAADLRELPLARALAAAVERGSSGTRSPGA